MTRKSIHKFRLSEGVGDDQFLEITYGAKLLSVQMQNLFPTLWFEVDQQFSAKEKRRFRLIGTGWDIPEKAVYCGTVQSGPYVWHVYEVHA